MLYTSNTQSFIETLYTNKDNGFSYEGAKVIVDYLDDFSDETNIEFDQVAIRCDYSEYTQKEIVSEFGYLLEETDGGDADEYFEMLLDVIKDNSLVLEVENENTYIIQAF